MNKGVIHYALNPPVEALRKIFPTAKFTVTDQIVFMSFSVFFSHILTNGAPGAGINEHMVLRPKIDLTSLQ